MSDTQTQMFLLGAGASFEAGIPGAVKLTELITDSQSNPKGSDERLADLVFNFAIGSILLQKAIGRSNPLTEQTDFEELISAIFSLQNRHKNDLAPFVSSWHPYITTLESYSNLESDILYDALLKTSELYKNDDGDTRKAKSDCRTELRHLLFEVISNYNSNRVSKEIMEVRDRRGSEIFEAAMDVLLDRLSRLTWLEPKDACSIMKTKYLHPLLKLCEKQKYLCIASLNYDNTIEIAAANVAPPLPINLGIVDWGAGKNMAAPDTGLYFLKLHGSIDWQFERASGTTNKLQVQTGKPWHKGGPKVDSKYYREPGIIFGKGNKLRPEGPFLSLLNAFQNELAKSQRLTVIGYSFRDVHINEQIRRWLFSQAHAQMVVISPSVDSDCPEVLSHLKETFHSQIQTIQKGAKAAIAEM